MLTVHVQFKNKQREKQRQKKLAERALQQKVMNCSQLVTDEPGIENTRCFALAWQFTVATTTLRIVVHKTTCYLRPVTTKLLL